MALIPSTEITLRNSEKVTLRSPQTQDAQALLEFRELIINNDPYNILTPGEFHLTLEQEQQWILQHIENPSWLAEIVELNSELVGFLGVKNLPQNRLAHVANLHVSVHPKHRRKGIASTMIERVIHWAKKHEGIEKLALAVFEENKPALNLYIKMGFVEEGRRIKEIKTSKNQYHNDIMMYRFVDQNI